MGEYARSLAIARAAGSHWPKAQIRFLVSREAPYAASVPFRATLLPSSPTFHSADVIKELLEFRPHVVIFDNAGRTAQLRAAQRIAARIVFISARARQRGKAFRWRWMRLIDEHWIAYPRFIAGDLRPLERLKLRLLRRPAVRYLDVILPRAAPLPGEALLPADVLLPADAPVPADALLPAEAPAAGGVPAAGAAEPYVLVVPGGGTGHPGAHDAVAQFRNAARLLAQGGAATLFVGPAADPDADGPAVAGLGCLAPQPQPQLIALMRGARLVVANGGSTLLQGMACGCACIGVPIAADQKQRIDACVAAGVARASDLSAASIVQAAQALLHDETQRAALARRAAELGLADGLDIAMHALGALVGSG